MTDQTTDRHTCHDQKTAAGPAWQCPRCSLPPAPQTAPLADRLAHPEAVREQVRRALDFTYAVSLGYESSDQLLATYDTSRTPADQTALRDRIAAAIRDAACTGDCGETEEECAKERIQPFAWHHGMLAVVEGSPEQFADAVLAVLPAPVDQGGFELRGAAEIRAAALREAADFVGNDDDCGCGGCDSCVPNKLAAELRRRADEVQLAKSGCWCGHAEDRHWTSAPNMTLPNGCHDCRGWNGAHIYGQDLPWTPESDAAEARQDGAQS